MRESRLALAAFAVLAASGTLLVLSSTKALAQCGGHGLCAICKECHASMAEACSKHGGPGCPKTGGRKAVPPVAPGPPLSEVLSIPAPKQDPRLDSMARQAIGAVGKPEPDFGSSAADLRKGFVTDEADGEDEAPRRATAVSVVGVVRVCDVSGKNCRTLKPGDTFQPGDKLHTRKGGACEFAVGGARYQLKENSELEVPDGANAAQGFKTAAALMAGRLKAFFRRFDCVPSKGCFVVKTPNAVAAVRGTGLEVSHENGLSKLAVLEHAVEWSAIDRPADASSRWWNIGLSEVMPASLTVSRTDIEPTAGTAW